MFRLALILALAAGLAAPVAGQRFLFSWRDKASPAAWHIVAGSLESGRVTARELAAVADLKHHYVFVGAAGDRAVLGRYGERSADVLDLKSGAITRIAENVLRPVGVSRSGFVYLALPDDQAGGELSLGQLKAYSFDACSTVVLTPEPVLSLLPVPPTDKSKPLESFWGVFLIEGKRVLGRISPADRKLHRAGEVPAGAMSVDISPNGKLALIGSPDTPATNEKPSAHVLTAKIETLDTATGVRRTIARTIHQQVPDRPGLEPRFGAMFAGNGTVIYSETVTDGAGGIAYQRLVAHDLVNSTAKELARIEDAARIVNAVPMPWIDGLIGWGEYYVDPDMLKVDLKSKRPAPFRIEDRKRLVVGGRAIGHIEPGTPIWEHGSTVAFFGRASETGDPALYVYAPGMQEAVPIRAGAEPVETFSFLEP